MKDFYNNRYAKKLSGEMERIKAFHDADNISFVIDLRRWGVFRNAKNILDIGGGWAIHSELIYRGAENGRVIKTDLSFVALKNISNKLGKFYESNILKTVCNCEYLPFESDIFDVIIFSQVLEHVLNDDMALKECNRLLRKGGTIVIAVPNCYEHLYKLFHPLERIFDESGHIHEYCAKTLRDKLIENGFTVQKQRYHCFFIFWIFAWLERTRFSFALQKFLSNHLLINEFFRVTIIVLLLLENAVLGNISKGGFSIQFVAKKQ